MSVNSCIDHYRDTNIEKLTFVPRYLCTTIPYHRRQCCSKRHKKDFSGGLWARGGHVTEVESRILEFEIWTEAMPVLIVGVAFWAPYFIHDFVTDPAVNDIYGIFDIQVVVQERRCRRLSGSIFDNETVDSGRLGSSHVVLKLDVLQNTEWFFRQIMNELVDELKSAEVAGNQTYTLLDIAMKTARIDGFVVEDRPRKSPTPALLDHDKNIEKTILCFEGHQA